MKIVINTIDQNGDQVFHGAQGEKYTLAQDGSTRYYKDCFTCQSARKRGSTFFPSHVASERCQSGKHAHCTCDTCF